jgi:flagellar protein FlaJ
MIVPFLPLPLKKAVRISRIFQRLGNTISKSIPSLKLNLYQAKMDVHPREYASVMVFCSIFYFILFNVLIFSIGLFLGRVDFFLPPVIGLSFSGFVFFYLIRWPKTISVKRMKILETNLLGALQHILIEIKSGVPLFNAMIGVSKGYGKISEEFEKVVKEINAGTPEIKALETASKRNPSLYFRRALWQLTNAMKAGSDVSAALGAVINTLTKDQVIAIRRYSQELNPYTMMYMLIAVIIPTLGITFLIILSSFSGIVVPKIIFPLIIIVLAVFQYFYMGIIKTKRPLMVK